MRGVISYSYKILRDAHDKMIVGGTQLSYQLAWMTRNLPSTVATNLLMNPVYDTLSMRRKMYYDKKNLTNQMSDSIS